MAEEKNDETPGKKGFQVFVWVIGTISGVWFVYAVYVAFPHVWACTEGWRTVGLIGPFPEQKIEQFNSCRSLNEFGDYLAGSFAPLAFLWLMIAVFIQSRELREQRDALEAQLAENRLQTEMLMEARERASTTSKRDDFDKLLSVIRSPAERINLGAPSNRSLSDVQFFQLQCKSIALQIMAAVQSMEDKKKQHFTDNVLKFAGDISEHMPRLVALGKQLDGEDLKVFETCQIQQLSDAIDVFDRYNESLKAPSETAD